jgi:thiol-disulfide isomerase/thioredoxin
MIASPAARTALATAAVLTTLAVGPAANAAAHAPAPTLKARTLKELPTPLPRPYDEAATPAQADAAIDAAFARARASGKRVIVDLGGNWCSWCRLLAAVMDLPEAKPFMAAHFEVVSVPVSSREEKRDDLNRQVLRRFGLRKADGYPYLIVTEPDGRVLARSSAVTDDRHHTPQTMLDWIARFAKPAHPVETAVKGREVRS